MATQIFPALSTSAAVYSESATYATARDTATAVLSPDSNSRIGQRLSGGLYQCYEIFTGCDLTSIAGATITGATPVLYDQYSDAVTPFNTTCANYDWGATVTTGDWRTAAQLTALTTRALLTTAGMADPGNVTLADVAMAAFLVAGAVNRFVIYSSRHAAGTAPSGDEYFTTFCTDATHGIAFAVTYTPAAVGTGDDPTFIGGGFI